mgnify:CR=1 FL=1
MFAAVDIQGAFCAKAVFIKSWLRNFTFTTCHGCGCGQVVRGDPAQIQTRFDVTIPRVIVRRNAIRKFSSTFSVGNCWNTYIATLAFVKRTLSSSLPGRLNRNSQKTTLFHQHSIMAGDEQKNIVIIGGGIIGATSAYFLTHHPSYNPDENCWRRKWQSRWPVGSVGLSVIYCASFLQAAQAVGRQIWRRRTLGLQAGPLRVSRLQGSSTHRQGFSQGQGQRDGRKERPTCRPREEQRQS